LRKEKGEVARNGTSLGFREPSRSSKVREVERFIQTERDLRDLKNHRLQPWIHSNQKARGRAKRRGFKQEEPLVTRHWGKEKRFKWGKGANATRGAAREADFFSDMKAEEEERHPQGVRGRKSFAHTIREKDLHWPGVKASAWGTCSAKERGKG